jgi:hypothetical protein
MVMRVLKVIEDVLSVDWEPLVFLHIGTLIVPGIRSKPLATIGDAYCYLGKVSQIVMMRRNTYRLVRFRESHFES